MDNGRINAIGTSKELLRTNEIYREVYFSQNRQDSDETEMTVSEAAA
jgi:ATP-binding cassette subfamily B protein